jgi:hypothetical protein
METSVNISHNLASYLLTPMITNHASNIFWDINAPKEDMEIRFLNAYYRESHKDIKYHSDYLVYLTFLISSPEAGHYLDVKMAELSQDINSKCTLIDNFNIGSTLCYVFEITEENLKKDYDFIIQGKYSKISPNYKEKILKFNEQYNITKFISAFSRDLKALKTLHKDLGCMKNKCTCLFSNFKNCNSFRDFDFDYSTQEIMSKFSEKDELTMGNILSKNVNLNSLLDFHKETQQNK